MASIGITGNRGQLGGGAGAASNQSYYHCHECDRTVNMLATSRLICPNCGGVFLEEFETPPPSPPPSPPSSTSLIDPFYFFHNSDSGSDIDLSELLPPPPPIPITTATGTTLFSQPPPPLPPRRSSNWDCFFFQEPDESGSNQYSDIFSEISHLSPSPSAAPAPPPPLPEPSRRPLPGPTMPNLIEDSDSEIELHNLLPPPPPPLHRPPSTGWEFFYPEEEEEEDGPNQHGSGTSQRLHLPPPPPPPWLQPQLPPETERLMDMRMTEELLALDSCQCAVCIEGFELNQLVKQMPCKHTYHSACILPWLDLQKTCPVCRYQLPLSSH